MNIHGAPSSFFDADKEINMCDILNENNPLEIKEVPE